VQVQTIVDYLGDYHQYYGCVPDPTVAQLLETDRPFRTAWADISDKLLKADADLQRMQRVRNSTSELLKVLDTLISAFEDPLSCRYQSMSDSRHIVVYFTHFST
jgi:hypothetical protein